MRVERHPVGGCRAVERHELAHAGLGPGQLFVGGPGAHDRARMHRESVARHVRLDPARPRPRAPRLAYVVPGMERVEEYTVRHLAGEADTSGVRARRPHQRRTVGVGPGIEERGHQREAVVLAAERRVARPPASTLDRVIAEHELADLTDGGARPPHRVAVSMCGLDLRAEPEHEAPPRLHLQVVRGLGDSIGLRENATVMFVISVTRSVCSAASASGRNGPCAASAVKRPSTPAASSARARSPAPSRRGPR